LAIYVGLSAAGLAMVGVVYALAMRLATQNWVEGWTLLFIAVLFVGGVQLMFMGVMGEYIGRIYGEVKRRPLYLVKEQLGFEPGGTPPCSEARAIRTPEAIMHPPRQPARKPVPLDAEPAA
jgi:dolichol-phosphate mannosyltransferase